MVLECVLGITGWVEGTHKNSKGCLNPNQVSSLKTIPLRKYRREGGRNPYLQAALLPLTKQKELCSLLSQQMKLCNSAGLVLSVLL